MSGELERSSAHEVSLDASAPEWLSELGFKVGASYKYRRESRLKRLLEDAAGYADTSEEAIGERAASEEGFGDVFLTAGQQAIDMGDSGLRDALARLVAAAFQDDARIETVSFLLGLVDQLEPVHLRVMAALVDLAEQDPGTPPLTVMVEAKVNADAGLTTAALVRLQSLGLVADEDTGQTGPPGAGVRLRPQWSLTDLGRQLLTLGRRADDRR